MVYWAGKAVEAVRIRSNPHTHTTFSDGRDAPRAQIERALALGFRALGFSDHAVQDVDAFTGIPKEREADYQSEVRALAKEYAGRIRVYLGLELDHHRAKEVMAELDRWIDEALPTQLTVDLAGLSFTDSSGIAVLLRAWRRMGQVRGAMRVIHTPSQADKVFQAAGLHRLIRFE